MRVFGQWRRRRLVTCARAELIKQSRTQPRRLGLARCILQTRDGRLRRQRCPACRTAADCDLHQRIVPQPVEVDGVLVAASDRRRTRHHHLEHRVPDALRIAPIRHRCRKPPAHPERGERHTPVAAILRPARTPKGSEVVAHGGCGGGLMHIAIRWNTDLLRESLVCAAQNVSSMSRTSSLPGFTWRPAACILERASRRAWFCVAAHLSRCFPSTFHLSGARNSQLILLAAISRRMAVCCCCERRSAEPPTRQINPERAASRVALHRSRQTERRHASERLTCKKAPRNA